MPARKNGTTLSEADEKQLRVKIGAKHIIGTLKFPQHTEELNAASRFPADKLGGTFSFPKSKENDEWVEMVRTLHEGIGGEHEIVRDGDEAEGDWDRNCWVVKFKLGKRPRFVDSRTHRIPAEEIEAYDTIRVQFNPYHYVSGNKEGVSLYAKYLMLLAKGDMGIEPHDDPDAFIYTGSGASDRLSNGHADDDTDDNPLPDTVPQGGEIKARDVMARIKRGGYA